MTLTALIKMTVSFLHSRERNYSVNSWEKFFRLSAYIFIEITLWIFHVNANEKFAKNFDISTKHESFNSQNDFDNSLKLQSICKNCLKNRNKKVRETFNFSSFRVNGMLRKRILCETIFIYWLLHKICN